MMSSETIEIKMAAVPAKRSNPLKPLLHVILNKRNVPEGSTPLRSIQERERVDSTVHTIPYSLRIQRSLLWRVDSKDADWHTGFAGYVWTEGEVTISKYSDTCGLGPKMLQSSTTEPSSHLGGSPSWGLNFIIL